MKTMEHLQQMTFYEAVPDSSYYPIALASCVTCLVLFTFISPALSRRVWRGYSRLPEGVRLDWDTRVVSTVHATTVSILAAYSHLYDDAMHSNLLWWDAFLVRAACTITVGYMVSDLIIITVYYKYMGETVYYFHHSASVYAYYYVLSYPLMPFYANFRLLSEISTPFLNIRWFLLTMGFDKYSHASVVNFLVFFVSFFFCRVLAIPLYWVKVHEIYLMEGFRTLGYIPVILVVTCLILDTLNIYWFHKLVQTLVKSLKAVYRSIAASAGKAGGLGHGGSSRILGEGSGGEEDGEKRAAKRVKSG